MLDHGERDERLEHRDFDLLPQAGALAGEKRRHDRIGAGQPRNLVGDDRAQIGRLAPGEPRSEEHTSELQSLMRISYAVFCLKKKKSHRNTRTLRDIKASTPRPKN